MRLGDGRYTLELPLEPPPDRWLAEITSSGAHLVSLNPIRQTLEDYFVEQVTSRCSRGRATDRGLEALTAGGRIV